MISEQVHCKDRVFVSAVRQSEAKSTPASFYHSIGSCFPYSLSLSEYLNSLPPSAISAHSADYLATLPLNSEIWSSRTGSNYRIIANPD